MSAPVQRATRSLLALAVLGVAARAQAYRTFEDDPAVGFAARWDARTIAWEVSTLDRPAAIDEASFADAARRALRTWQQTGCGPADPSRVQQTDLAAAPADGRNTIQFVSGWQARGLPLEQAALADVQIERYGQGIRIVEVDVYLDASRPYALETGEGQLDLQTVLTHEVGGHGQGLLHPCELGGASGAPDCAASADHASSALYPAYSPDGSGRSLGADDVEGICALYRTPSSCAESCARGLVCSAGRCVDPTCGEPSCLREPPMCAADGTCSEGACAVAGYDEGYCVAPGSHGAACAQGEDCASGLCLTSARVGSYCTVECRGDAECAGMQRCTALEGRRVCAPLTGTGCSASSSAAGAPWSSIGLLAFLLLVRRLRCWPLSRRGDA
ncbi:MAG: hypothetical protein K8H88_23500 [Sandaracinaceae bacterium]|nr:hypothetical protein [Sandaracinaceae bacterium]